MAREEQKNAEVSTAKDFLEETGLLKAEIQTLAEFVGSECRPAANKHYDDMCPDVVAVSSAGNIGIELTAYSANDVENASSSSKIRVSKYVRDDLSSSFPDLQGIYISWEPNTENVLSKNRAPAFAEELLNFVRAEHKGSAMRIGDVQKHPEYQALPNSSLFETGSLLKKYAKSVTVHRPKNLQSSAVSVIIGGNTTIRATSAESLSATIKRKSDKLAKAHKEKIDEVWLLIHATRRPTSSDIYPLFPQEIERLLESDAAEQARRSDFSRVILWDGVDGGYVDLKTGVSSPVAA